MIRIEITSDSKAETGRFIAGVDLSLRGDLDTLTLETCLMISHIHRSIAKESPESGEAFRHAVTAVLDDPDGGVWDLPDQTDGAVGS